MNTPTCSSGVPWTTPCPTFSMCLWPACASMAALCAWCFTYAFVVFGFYSLLPPTIAIFFDAGRMGSVVGNVFVAFVPGSFSPVFAGFCYDRWGSYLVAQVYVPLGLFAAGATLTLLRPPGDGDRGGTAGAPGQSRPEAARGAEPEPAP